MLVSPDNGSSLLAAQWCWWQWWHTIRQATSHSPPHHCALSSLQSPASSGCCTVSVCTPWLRWNLSPKPLYVRHNNAFELCQNVYLLMGQSRLNWNWFQSHDLKKKIHKGIITWKLKNFYNSPISLNFFGSDSIPIFKSWCAFVVHPLVSAKVTYLQKYWKRRQVCAKNSSSV